MTLLDSSDLSTDFNWLGRNHAELISLQSESNLSYHDFFPFIVHKNEESIDILSADLCGVGSQETKMSGSLGIEKLGIALNLDLRGLELLCWVVVLEKLDAAILNSNDMI